MTNLPFEFDRPEDSPGFLLWQTMITWQRLIKKALEPHDISHAQFVIMALLLWLKEHNHETTQVVIATYSKLDKMTVSSSLKKLACDGLVVRVEHNIDTRAKCVSLTNKGKMLICKIIPLVKKIDHDFFEIIAQNEQKTLMQILQKVNSRGINDS
ncbi:MAG: winged helix DNA-binding protein [Pseudomonadota bacterium]